MCYCTARRGPSPHLRSQKEVFSAGGPHPDWATSARLRQRLLPPKGGSPQARPPPPLQAPRAKDADVLGCPCTAAAPRAREAQGQEGVFLPSCPDTASRAPARLGSPPAHRGPVRRRPRLGPRPRRRREGMALCPPWVRREEGHSGTRRSAHSLWRHGLSRSHCFKLLCANRTPLPLFPLLLAIHV